MRVKAAFTFSAEVPQEIQQQFNEDWGDHNIRLYLEDDEGDHTLVAVVDGKTYTLLNTHCLRVDVLGLAE